MTWRIFICAMLGVGISSAIFDPPFLGGQWPFAVWLGIGLFLLLIEARS
jgi:hypothetical protein